MAMDVDGLRARFQEVAERANRLRTWSELEVFLRNIDWRLESFVTEIQAALGPPMKIDATTFPKLQQAWKKFSHTELSDLESSYRGTPADSRPPLEQFDPDQIKKVCNSIAEALRTQNLKELADAADDLQRQVQQILSFRRIIVRKELDEICSLARELKRQLQESPAV